MFTFDTDTHIDGKDIIFVDMSCDPNYPTEIFILFNPDIYKISPEDFETFKTENNSDKFSVIHDNPCLLQAGIIHATPLYKDDMARPTRITLAEGVKTDVRAFILAHSID